MAAEPPVTYVETQLRRRRRLLLPVLILLALVFVIGLIAVIVWVVNLVVDALFQPRRGRRSRAAVSAAA